MPKREIADLNKMYQEADTCDKEIFAEQRTNLLLVAGEHYTRRSSKFYSRIRDDKQLNSEQKLRLVKNHIGKIAKTYVNNIISFAPDVAAMPQNEKELSDVKAAQLNQSVWLDLKRSQGLKEKKLEWCENFVQIGEVAAKIFWDTSAGDFLGYEQAIDPATGEPQFDEQGQPLASDKAAFRGAILFESVEGFNLLRDINAKSMDESHWLGIRKMQDIDVLKHMVGDDEEKLNFIEASSQDVFKVFDGSSGEYKEVKGQCQVREYFFRPCVEYPMGYFYITTEKGILFEGELPGGVFPIVYKGFERIATHPRARSRIKQLRPWQIELNRCASKIAEHQITLGDDKLLIQAGTKLSSGGQLPGIKGVTFQGMAPTILPGRSGDQYLTYMQSQVEEMYRVADLEEDYAPKEGQFDPWAMLHMSMRHKKKFSLYAEKFESFLVKVAETALELAKIYYDDDMLIPAIGKCETINIQEFKSTEKLRYKIALEPQSEDIDTKMGRQLIMNHVMQYVGPQLGKDDIGKMLQAMPYMNNSKAFGDYTIDSDKMDNDILAMDRGQPRPARPNDNHQYIISRLTQRMSQSDFEFMDPKVQELYNQKLQEHTQVDSQQKKEIQAAKDGFIPASGPLIAADIYVEDKAKPGVSRRARIPYDSVKWLIDQLETQGMPLSELESMNQGAAAQEAGFMNQQPQGPGPQNSMPQPNEAQGPWSHLAH